jgi:site-specific recombinase XerC
MLLYLFGQHAVLKEKTRPPRKKHRSTATDDVLAGEFLLYLEGEKNASPHTQTSYRIALEAFQRFRPDLSWKSATADDFRAFLFHLMKAERARSSIRVHPESFGIGRGSW